MKTVRSLSTLQTQRSSPLWRLLAADNAPAYIALLQGTLLDGERVQAASALLENLRREIEKLRIEGVDLAQSPQAYLANWLAQGWLTRRFLPGAQEEEYELTADAIEAIRIASSLEQPKARVTESRLAIVMQQLSHLAEATDTNPESRRAALLASRDRIDEELARIDAEGVQALPDDRAQERLLQTIEMAVELMGDFPRVRDRFEIISRNLREQLLSNDGSRGKVLEEMFAGVDHIEKSDEGRTFSAFWRLLTDRELSSSLEESVDELLKRPFAERLDRQHRLFLKRMTSILFKEGQIVRDAMLTLSRNLRHFVQSREYLEHRRLRQVIRDTQRLALEARGHYRPGTFIGYNFMRTSCEIRSVSQWQLKDPAEQVFSHGMMAVSVEPIDLAAIGEIWRRADIDFRALKKNILSSLAQRHQISIAQILSTFPAEQGLGSVLGYIDLGNKHGTPTGNTENIFWVGLDGTPRGAEIPEIHFLKERSDELQ